MAPAISKMASTSKLQELGLSRSLEHAPPSQGASMGFFFHDSLTPIFSEILGKTHGTRPFHPLNIDPTPRRSNPCGGAGSRARASPEASDLPHHVGRAGWRTVLFEGTVVGKRACHWAPIGPYVNFV